MVDGLLNLLIALIKLPFVLLADILKIALSPVFFLGHLLMGLVWMVVWAGLAAWIGQKAGLNPALCAIAGFLLGPLGVAIVVVIALVVSAQRTNAKGNW
jgi:type IV secretory pathway VirB2 component (pilin)